MPVLAVAAAARARSAPSAETRIAFGSLAAWFIAIALFQIGLIVHPRSAVQRRDALLTFLLGWWISAASRPGGPGRDRTGAAWTIVRRNESRHYGWAVALGFGAFSLLLVIATAVTGPSGFLFAVWPEFAARNNAVAVSLPLAVLFLVAASRPATPAAWMRPPMAALVLFLALGQVGWQALGVHYWSLFIADFQSVLTARRGSYPGATLLPVSAARRRGWIASRGTGPTRCSASCSRRKAASRP